MITSKHIYSVACCRRLCVAMDSIAYDMPNEPAAVLYFEGKGWRAEKLKHACPRCARLAAIGTA